MDIAKPQSFIGESLKRSEVGKFILAASFFAFAFSGAEAAQYELHDGGYKYSFKEVQNITNEQDVDSFGDLEISHSRTGRVMLYERTALIPGCRNFSPVSLLTISDSGSERHAVILCGSLGGRHYTLKIYTRHPAGFSVSSLDFHDIEPSLTLDPRSGSYIAITSKPMNFPGIDPRLKFPQVYVLRFDAGTTGFVPVVKEGRELYLAYYRTALDSLGTSDDIIGVVVAALISIDDVPFKCGEWQKLRARHSLADLSGWLEKLEGAGYPEFDLRMCEAR